MNHSRDIYHKPTKASAYQYEVDPSLHDSQRPSEVPRVKRNLVQNLVAQFNEEAKKRECRRQHSTDDSFASSGQGGSDGRDVSPPLGLVEASDENAPNHNHPFSYTNNVNSSSSQKSSLGPRSRSDFNIRTPPSEVIYAQVVVNGQRGSDSGKRKTTVHTKVPNRVATESLFGGSKKLLAKSTGSLNMSAQEEEVDDESNRKYHLLKNGDQSSYYKYSEVDENIHNRFANVDRRGGGDLWNGPRSNGFLKKDEDERYGRKLEVAVDRNDPNRALHVTKRGLSLPLDHEVSKVGDGNYETRNVERWSEKEDGPNSRKYKEHEYIHEVSVSHDKKKTAGGSSAAEMMDDGLREHRSTPPPLYIMGGPVSKVTGTRFGDGMSSLRRENAMGRKHPDYDRKVKRWEEEIRSAVLNTTTTTTGGHNNKENASLERKKTLPGTRNHYYFGDRFGVGLMNGGAPDKPPRHKWPKHELADWSTGFESRRWNRRGSNDSGTSSGVGLLSSKLVKKANERVSGIDMGLDTVDGWHRDGYFTTRTRRASEGDDDVFAVPPSSMWGGPPATTSLWKDRDGSRIVGYESPSTHANGYTEESRKVFERKETVHKTKQRTTHHHHEGAPEHDRQSPSRRHPMAIEQRYWRSESPRIGQHHDRRRDPSISSDDAHHRKEGGVVTSTPLRSREDHHHHHQRKMERHVDVEVGEKATSSRRHHQPAAHHHRKHEAFQKDETEDKMETSESEPSPLYGGSQESRMSLGSRQSLAEEDAMDNRSKSEDIIAAHVNTPQSLVRQMNRRQINYENAQQSTSTTNTGRRFWFERSQEEEEEGGGGRSHSHRVTDRDATAVVDANRNYYQGNNNNNVDNRWTSATMSRLETNKNRLNGAEEDRWKAHTVDRHGVRRRKGDAIHIQVNNRDAEDINVHHVGRSSSFNSRFGSSENESQSAGSAASSRNSSPAKPKRVNFKSKSPPPSNRGGGAELSPVHREALMRSASPARAPSTTGSMRSMESDASNKSVILHATAVADIPPARQYCYRSANTSPSPPASSLGVSAKSKDSRSVHRSFSLLSPWKPRKYKEKYEKQSLKNGSAPNIHQAYHEEAVVKEKSKQKGHKKKAPPPQEADVVSANSSSEKLDSLSPLPSEAKSSKKKKKKAGILRRHSMPKDSRFANFFRRKKEPKS